METEAGVVMVTGEVTEEAINIKLTDVHCCR